MFFFKKNREFKQKKNNKNILEKERIKSPTGRKYRCEFLSLFFFLRVDVPDFGEERRQFFVFELEREAHLRVEVAESAQLRQD